MVHQLCLLGGSHEASSTVTGNRDGALGVGLGAAAAQNARGVVAIDTSRPGIVISASHLTPLRIPMRISIVVGALGATALAAALSCGPKPKIENADLPSRPVDHCTLIRPIAPAPDTVLVALFDSVDWSHAPVPHNDAERLVFAQLYEVLPQTQCERHTGDARSGLADAPLDEGAGPMTMTIRAGARFWDGSPVTAHDVADSFSRANYTNSVAIVDERTVTILPSQHIMHLSAIADPRFSITKTSLTSYPMGTGAYRPTDTGVGEVILVPAFDSSCPAIRFMDCRRRDPKDMIDATLMDVMIVNDYDVKLYAERHQRFKVPALPPTKSYVIVASARIEALQHGDTLGDLSESIRHELARDAVRSAYAWPVSEEERWWRDTYVSVSSYALTRLPRSTERRILYNASDGVAGDIANRIASLSTMFSSVADSFAAALPGLRASAQGVKAIGVLPGEFDSHLRRGDDFAYVLAVPFDVTNPTTSTMDIVRAIPWLTGDRAVRLGNAILTLVATRSFVIVANRHYGQTGDPIGISSDRFGNVRIYGRRELDKVP